ncbi:MAG: hypothetical protein ACD_65C00201G0004 [uncultured bacterium]|nr:MAG: hypothetical protein ACD_65C00201G0004 [uncultured bacterium]KKT02437.1 MAG: hypothetical protein UV80_C0003G0023 [Candidatus Peregrinibacteria bacterium GW2011_GWF2_43_17]KKT19334.1 MAG: hypothetical protein UW03_C0020G0039 [Candidatus Peregrinibacteria bacterium GW2011_GWA2_43_8]HAU40159.1 hypothetical protein [Candidatus Peregrinibacteria bacterium]
MGLNTQQPSSESYESLAIEEWTSRLKTILSNLNKIPEEMIHRGPTFTVETKNGETLTCETLYFNFIFGKNYQIRKPVNTNGAGIMHFVFAKNTSGEIVGLRISSIFNQNKNEMLAQSRISVKYRGKGLAMPTENAFIKSMQWLANTLDKNIVWKVYNENLVALDLAKERGNVSTKILTALESEQQRWQAMYGPGGKLGINNKGKRIFRPISA